MKTEHEKLKWIIDTIGYDCKFEYEDNKFIKEGNYIFDEVVDVREIIFTPEFKVKLWGYFYHNVESMFEIDLIQNLDDPVEYLYNLLK